MTIAVALVVRVTPRLFVRLLHLFRLFRWPVVILLAESRHECAEGQNQSHQHHHCYSLNFFHKYLPPPRILRFHAEERRGVRAALASSNMGASTLFGRCIQAESLVLIESYYNCWPDCAASLAVLACKFIRLKLHSHRMVHRYRRNVTLRLPTLLLLSKARIEIVCSPGPTIVRSSE